MITIYSNYEFLGKNKFINLIKDKSEFSSRGPSHIPIFGCFAFMGTLIVSHNSLIFIMRTSKKRQKSFRIHHLET